MIGMIKSLQWGPTAKLCTLLFKKKQMEMLELKSMIIEMKISLEGSVVDVN